MRCWQGAACCKAHSGTALPPAAYSNASPSKASTRGCPAAAREAVGRAVTAGMQTRASQPNRACITPSHPPHHCYHTALPLRCLLIAAHSRPTSNHPKLLPIQHVRILQSSQGKRRYPPMRHCASMVRGLVTSMSTSCTADTEGSNSSPSACTHVESSKTQKKRGEPEHVYSAIVSCPPVAQRKQGPGSRPPAWRSKSPCAAKGAC